MMIYLSFKDYFKIKKLVNKKRLENFLLKPDKFCFNTFLFVESNLLINSQAKLKIFKYYTKNFSLISQVV